MTQIFVHKYACNNYSLLIVLISLSHQKYVCIQCIIIENKQCKLLLTYKWPKYKLSDWNISRSDYFRSCFCLLVGLVIFVMEFYDVFKLRRMVGFCGDSALFAGSFYILLNLYDTFIILTSTRFNAALIFFLICCRISSSVDWSNKASISPCMSSFIAAVVVYSPMLRLLLHGIFPHSQHWVTS